MRVAFQLSWSLHVMQHCFRCYFCISQRVSLYFSVQPRASQDLIIEAIYLGLIGGKMDQERQTVSGQTDSP